MRISPESDIPVSYPEKDPVLNAQFPRESVLQEHVRATFLNSGLPWFYYHVGDSRRDYAGFPDVTAVHALSGAIIYAELKATPKARVSLAQISWMLALSRNPGVEVYLIRPSDLGELYDAMERVHNSYRI